MIDLLVAGGTVVDGTGAPPRRADVGIRDGRIVLDPGVLSGAEPARRLDADGLVVAPGFVDVHTHYDAQLGWDPAALPSPLHGVTTVIGGNCGFGLAPLPASGDRTDWLARMFARVEGIPLEAMQAGLAWDWSDFGSWFRSMEGKLGVNAGFLVGHSALRHHVLGDEAATREASDTEVAAMGALLDAALTEGALGFSTSQAPTHHDGDGRPVPSRAAAPAELLALSSRLRDRPGTSVEVILPGCLGRLSDDEAALMAAMSVVARSAVNWNVLGVSASRPEGHRHQLAATRRATEGGGRVVALTLPYPVRVRLSFNTGAILEGLPGWSEVFALDHESRTALLCDASGRGRLAAAAAAPDVGVLGALTRWDRLTITETFAPVNAGVTGLTVGDVAAAKGMDPFDVLCEIVVADELRTGLVPPRYGESNADWATRVEVMAEPDVVVGGSDAGAHADMMCGAVYTTTLLGEAVRERGLLTIEAAVRLLSDVPARLYGLAGRGRIVDGAVADLVLFDPDLVAPGPERTVDDLPGGASRLYAGAVGVPHVLVGGAEIVRDGVPTGALAGTLLRSGRDTVDIDPAGASRM